MKWIQLAQLNIAIVQLRQRVFAPLITSAFAIMEMFRPKDHFVRHGIANKHAESKGVNGRLMLWGCARHTGFDAQKVSVENAYRVPCASIPDGLRRVKNAKFRDVNIQHKQGNYAVCITTGYSETGVQGQRKGAMLKTVNAVGRMRTATSTFPKAITVLWNTVRCFQRFLVGSLKSTKRFTTKMVFVTIIVQRISNSWLEIMGRVNAPMKLSTAQLAPADRLEEIPN